MATQIFRTLSSTVLVLLMLASCLSCRSNETARYAKQSGLLDESIKIVRQLPYDANTKALIDQISGMPTSAQNSESVLDYLKDVAKDRIVTDDELTPIKAAAEISSLDISHNAKTSDINSVLSSPEARNAYESLKSYSDEAVRSILEFGLDGDVPAWVALNSTLPHDVAEYDFKTTLCIQDKKLTPLETDFLKDREKHNGQMLDYYLTQVSNGDPELVDKIKMVPYFKTKDISLTEALEDIGSLAGNPENKKILEKIYGKGIERKMWPVALERLIYKAFNSEFDVNNPLEGQDLTIETRLADFQTKYNTEMDQEGIPGPKPAIRGMNILHEPLGNPMIDERGNAKTDDDLRFDYVLMRWVLRCNAARIWGNVDYGDCFHHVELAQSEDLDTWLVFYPVVQPPFREGNDYELLAYYKNLLTIFSEKAQQNNVKGLWVGAELDAWWRLWGGYDGIATDPSGHSQQLRKYIDELVEIARQNYSGRISYQEWDYWSQYDNKVNWNNMDNVSLSPWVGSYNPEMRNEQQYMKAFLKMKERYNKPLYIVEVGSPTITEAEEIGGPDSLISNPQLHYDQKEQAILINKYLSSLYQVGASAIFICMWDEPADHPFGYGNSNKQGKGVWDYVEREPKLGFWSVYKYYK